MLNVSFYFPEDQKHWATWG